MEVAEVTWKLTAWGDHMDSALQQRLEEAFASFFFQTRLLDNAFEKQKTVIGEYIAESNVVALISDECSNIRKEHLVNFIVSIPNLENKRVFIKSISTGETQLTGDNVAKIIKKVIAVVGVNKVNTDKINKLVS